MVKTDFGTKKIEGVTKLYGWKQDTIFGCQLDSIDATLSRKDNSIFYAETTEGAISTTHITVHLERLYKSRGKSLESVSADISLADRFAKISLDTSLHLDSEKGNYLKFLSQQPVDNWRREMELKTGNLK
jgi:hypothetical protein